MAKRNKKPIWEVARDLTKDLPEEVLATLPCDGATNHDDYLNENVGDTVVFCKSNPDETREQRYERIKKAISKPSET